MVLLLVLHHLGLLFGVTVIFPFECTIFLVVYCLGVILLIRESLFYFFQLSFHLTIDFKCPTSLIATKT